MIEVWPAGITRHGRNSFYDEADPVFSQEGYTMTDQKQILCTVPESVNLLSAAVQCHSSLSQRPDRKNITKNESGMLLNMTAPDAEFYLDRKGWVCYDNHTFTW